MWIFFPNGQNTKENSENIPPWAHCSDVMGLTHIVQIAQPCPNATASSSSCFLAMIALIRTFHDSHCFSMEIFPVLIPTQRVFKLQKVLKFNPKAAITYDEVCLTPCLQRFVQYLTLESLQNKRLAFVNQTVTYSVPVFSPCLSLLPSFKKMNQKLHRFRNGKDRASSELLAQPNPFIYELCFIFYQNFYVPKVKTPALYTGLASEPQWNGISASSICF